MTAPTVTAARKRGVIRVDLSTLQSPAVAELRDSDYRCLTQLWAWVARFAEGDEVDSAWLEHFEWVGSGGRGHRVGPARLGRFLEFGLLEHREYDDGTQAFAVAGWRDFRPADLTSAERKRRFRRKLYGANYYGTEGDVQEVVLAPHTPEEVAELEAEGRAFLAELDRNREREFGLGVNGDSP